MERLGPKALRVTLEESLRINIFAVGNAKLDGLTKDLHITGNQYLLTLTIYFIGYVSTLILPEIFQG